MSVSCKIVSARLPSLDPAEPAGGSLTSHMARCLACQAEAARYRKLARALGRLGDDVVEAPSGLAAAVEFAIDRVAPTTPVRRVGKVVTATGAIAATAGVVALAVWRRTRHAA